ncbi:hypothetical protein G9A89_005261 [Geosiphon pyriformis]|nr:hypothetical protein G9A89_005261 [Geosiphon pyriformis]
MTDFGLTGRYRVWDSLDQDERIFYDSLLCKVKRHEHLCGYQIDTKFVARTGRIETSGRMFSFFAIGVFVDDTIWVNDCQMLMQYALNIVSEFFAINNISINNKKTVTILINQSVRVAFLSISGQPILIAKKGETHRYLGIFLSIEELFKLSVVKAHSNMHFFVNVVLRKVITDKQFSYLVAAVLQPIVSYRTQFNFVSLEICHKWDAIIQKGFRSKTHLPHDFLVKALHHSSLYGLKFFEQLQSECKSAVVISFFNALDILGHLFNHKFLDLQVLSWAPLNPLQFPIKLHISLVNNFLAGVVKIFLDSELFLANNLPSAFHSPGVFLISSVLGNALYFSLVYLLKHFGVAFGDRLFNKKSCLMDWKTFCHWKKLNPRGPVSFWFVIVSKFLINIDSLSAACTGDSFLPELNVLNSVEFSNIQNDVGTAGVADNTAAYFSSVNLSVDVKLQAVALVLECVPSFCTVVLYLDSQAAIDACVSEMFLAISDFYGHSGVIGNVVTDAAADHAICSKFFLPVRVHKRFLVAEATAVSDNVCHFVRDVFWTICCACWEAGLGQVVVSSDIVGVWHSDFHMLAGFTSWEFSSLYTYLMKAVYQQLSVAVRKGLYNRRYPDMLCLLYGKVELPDHVFTCILDAGIWEEVLAEAFTSWTSLLDVNGLSFSAVLQTLSWYFLNISLYSVLCKGFVLKNWCKEAVDVFDRKKEAFCVVVGFVRQLAEADMERAELVGNNDLVLGLLYCIGSVLSEKVIRMLGIIESFAVSFGCQQLCLFFTDLNYNSCVVLGV